MAKKQYKLKLSNDYIDSVKAESKKEAAKLFEARLDKIVHGFWTTEELLQYIKEEK